MATGFDHHITSAREVLSAQRKRLNEMIRSDFEHGNVVAQCVGRIHKGIGTPPASVGAEVASIARAQALAEHHLAEAEKLYKSIGQRIDRAEAAVDEAHARNRTSTGPTLNA